MNALSGDTYLFAEIDGKYGVFTLKELYELHNQGHKIKVPALLNEEEFKKATAGLQIKEYETAEYKGTTFTFLEASGKETIFFIKVKPEREEHYYVQQEERVFLILKELLQEA